MNLTTPHAMSNTSPASAKSLVGTLTLGKQLATQHAFIIACFFMSICSSFMAIRVKLTSVGLVSFCASSEIFACVATILESHSFLVVYLKPKGVTMSNLTILNAEIRTYNNLYSLNDLHEVSGSEAKNQPNRFLRLSQTKELIAEIERYPYLGNGEVNRCSDLSNATKIKRGGLNQGTFVCKELVYAYAMWISPKFNLAVIRAFDQLHNQPPRIENTVNIADYHKRGMEQIKASQALAKANAHKPKSPGIEYYYRKAMGMPPRVEK